MPGTYIPGTGMLLDSKVHYDMPDCAAEYLAVYTLKYDNSAYTLEVVYLPVRFVSLLISTYINVRLINCAGAYLVYARHVI